VVGELVARDADDPGDVEWDGATVFEVAHGGKKGLRGQVLGRGRVPAAVEEVPVHLRNGLLIEGEERGAVGLARPGTLAHGRAGPFAHHPIIAPSL